MIERFYTHLILEELRLLGKNWSDIIINFRKSKFSIVTLKLALKTVTGTILVLLSLIWREIYKNLEHVHLILTPINGLTMKIVGIYFSFFSLHDWSVWKKPPITMTDINDWKEKLGFMNHLDSETKIIHKTANFDHRFYWHQIIRSGCWKNID